MKTCHSKLNSLSRKTGPHAMFKYTTNTLPFERKKNRTQNSKKFRKRKWKMKMKTHSKKWDCKSGKKLMTRFCRKKVFLVSHYCTFTAQLIFLLNVPVHNDTSWIDRKTLGWHSRRATQNIRVFSTMIHMLGQNSKELTVFAEINAHQKSEFSKGGVHKTDGFRWVIFQRGEYTKPMAFDGWFFKGGSTQNRWLLMGDFSKGGVHKTDGFWWVIFQRGEYIKPMGFDGWFFKGGSTQNRWLLMGDFSKGGVHKTDGFWWGVECFFIASKN